MPIFQGACSHGKIFRGPIIPGVIFWEAIILGAIFWGQYSGGQIYGEKFSGHHSEVMENLNITENELKQSAVLSGYQHFKNMNIITKHLMALDAGQSFKTKKSTKRGK